jgi:hypothetical protein
VLSFLATSRFPCHHCVFKWSVYGQYVLQQRLALCLVAVHAAELAEVADSTLVAMRAQQGLIVVLPAHVINSFL